MLDLHSQSEELDLLQSEEINIDLVSHSRKLTRRESIFSSGGGKPRYHHLQRSAFRVGPFSPTQIRFRSFDQLRNQGLKHDTFTLSSLVKACKSLEENEIAHGVCLRLGFGRGAFLVSGLVENYSKSGDIVSAEKCFRECLGVDNVVHTTMVCGLTFVIGALLDVKEGEHIHVYGVKMGLLSNHLNNAAMNMYVRFVKKLDVVKVFDEITDPYVVSWTERIGAASDGVEALELFKVLIFNGFEINKYTMTNVLSAISGERLLKPGKQIQGFCYRAGFFQMVSTGNALVTVYGKSGKIDDARRVFDYMICRDSVSWNSVIVGYSENGFVDQAIMLFKHMRDFSVLPNNYTMASILISFCSEH
ncbi:hypothetical protein Ddye_023559 [Dipteronia dyeriana]|uniref:Pentatricopeptide repeat-containing protein n=1 Tax=Dipteronia dyeriana TaxID=168575 RepID=A0AAD9TTU6_9ROSI|nr:hypothetical protein Ddye_023559 [Dipteronia dyeriana]